MPHPVRKSPRLQGYDYRQPGAYFVTICTAGRVRIFGEVVEDRVRLTEAGEVAAACWRAIPSHHPHVALDAFVVMPNHVHGILLFVEDDAEGPVGGIIPNRGRDTIYRVPTPDDSVRQFGEAKAGSLSVVVATYKAAVTREVNRRRGAPGPPLWQGRFHDHVVRLRDPAALDRTRRYVEENPLRWHLDRENPARRA